MDARPSLDPSRTTLPTLLLALLASGVGAQQLVQQATPSDRDATRFATVFGGSGSEMATALAHGPGRDLYVTGWSHSNGAGDADVWLARVDPRGHARWERVVGGTSREEAQGVTRTPDGGALIVGSTRSFGAGGLDAWAVRFDAAGSVLWQRAYGFAQDDEFRTVTTSPDGFYVGGYTLSAKQGPEAWILELDPQGNVLWQQTLGGSLDDRVLSLDRTDQGVVLVASSNSDLEGSQGVLFMRPWVVELDGAGNVVWQKTYNVSGGDYWSHVVSLESGGFAVAGEVIAFGFNRGDLWAVELDATGNVVRDRRYGDNFGTNWFDSGVAIQPTSSGGYAVLGSTETAGAGSQDAWMVGLDEQLGLEWGATYGGHGFDGGQALLRTRDGFVLAGRVQVSEGAQPDVLLVGIGPRGRAPMGCGLTREIDPNVWSSPIAVDAVNVVPVATAAVPLATAAGVVAVDTETAACSPLTLGSN